MKTKHTPGNWEIKDIYFPGTKVHKGLHIFSNQKYDDREICDMWGSATEEGQANAKLIAAAPDLLEALMNIENDDNRIPSKIWEMRNQAIKKATE